MKRSLFVLVSLILAITLAGVPAAPAAASPAASITLLNPPPGGVLVLSVGESYTFDLLITSDEPFVVTIAQTDAYYPGRGVFWTGSDRATRSTSAVLHLTVTGKASTSDLAAVCDWPEPGVCWDDGVAPLGIVAGVRYKGGVVIAQRFSFAVQVP